jgi:hypothetical protein
MLVLWLYLFAAEGAFGRGPNGETFAADFAMFEGAAKVMQDGGNPYNHALLYRTERAMLARQGMDRMPARAVVRVGNPPLFFWAMEPLVRLPFRRVALAWSIFLYALSALSFLLLLRFFGWRRRSLPLLVFLLMPQVVFGPYYGNAVSLVFFGICVALALSRRYPFLAGSALVLAWLKPPVALPIVLLILVFHGSRRARMASGFAVTSAAMFAFTLLATGFERTVQWLQGLAGYSHDLGSSPDIASFAGLYVRNVPGGLRLSIHALGLAVGIIFTALVWHRKRSNSVVPWISVAWLWALWFFLAPYAHFFDEVLLTVPILVLLGTDAVRLSWREPATALYMVFASLLVISAAPGNVQLLWLPLLVILLCLYIAGRSTRYRDAIHRPVLLRT